MVKFRKTTRRAHHSSKANKASRTRRVKNRTPTPYPRAPIQSHATYMNVSETWVNGQGRRNTVVIRNGEGEKRVEHLGPAGHVMKQQTRRLTPAERGEILRGKFIPGLWRNCQC